MSILPEPESHNPRISVVIPVYNMVETIGDCIQALNRQTIPRASYEIIVVDDGSTDGTGRVAERCGATRVVRKPRGGYAAAARNLGVRVARGDIICFTDADCIPRPDWIAQLIAPLADPAVVGAKGVYTTEQRSLVARFVQLEYEEKYAELQQQPSIRVIDTNAAVFRREVLLSSGGFNEAFPNLEDREFSFRLAAQGYKMVIQPHARVNHLHVDNLPEYMQKKWSNGYWAAQLLRLFPTYSADDTYTPQTQKIQLLLMAAMLGGLGLMIFYRPLGLLALVAAFLFMLSTLGFIRQAWGKDRPAALAAPLFLAARAIAVGFGYAWGLLRPVSLEQETLSISGLDYRLKRSTDILVALTAMLCVFVLLPVVALVNRGRIWEKTMMIGQYGAPFTRRAFRPVSFLPQRWHKLPYFWHVLKGEMSLVGPRPETQDAMAEYTDQHRQILAVKPGLVSYAAKDLPLDERVQLELEYIHRYSLHLDLRLLRRAITGTHER